MLCKELMDLESIPVNKFDDDIFRGICSCEKRDASWILFKSMNILEEDPGFLHFVIVVVDRWEKKWVGIGLGRCK
jgi:hypothetical protein